MSVLVVVGPAGTAFSCAGRARSVDGRGRVVTLTTEGLELIDRAFTEHIANEHRLVGLLGRRRAEELEDLLRSWLACFE